MDDNTAARIEAALAKHMPRAGGVARAIAYGNARLSGADLQGKARQWGARYATTRRKVIAALAVEDVAYETVTAHNKRILVYKPIKE